MVIRQGEKYLLKRRENLTEIHSLENLGFVLKDGESGNNMKRNLLIESSPVKLSLVEGVSGGKVIARGEFGRCGVPTQNGRIYPEKLMQREIDRLQEDISNRRILGELDHPNDGKTSLKRVSHVITGLTIKDGLVIGEAEILNTPEGKTLKALIEADVQVGVSSRAWGSTAPYKGQSEAEEVQEDLVLKTYDFVADPAVKTAIPGIYTEDVDDPTLAKMFLDEFPEVADSLRKGNDSVLSEGSDSNKSNENIPEDISEKFERRLRDELADLKKVVRDQIMEEVSSDPEISGAKAILSAVADLVGSYNKDPNENDVRAAIKASELEVSEANRERDDALTEAMNSKCWLEIERKISGHPMIESIRNLMGGREYKSIDEAISILDVILKDIPGEKIVKEEDVKIREENVDLRGKITLLESKVEELSGKLVKVSKLSERIDEQRRGDLEEANSKISELEDKLDKALLEAIEAKNKARNIFTESEKKVADAQLEVYKLQKVAQYTNGRELMGLMEDVHSRSRVDELVRKRGLTEVSDPDLQYMRKTLGKGKTSSNPIVEDSNYTNDKRIVTELGHNVHELASLSGITIGNK
jgi:hypothetical protein